MSVNLVAPVGEVYLSRAYKPSPRLKSGAVGRGTWIWTWYFIGGIFLIIPSFRGEMGRQQLVLTSAVVEFGRDIWRDLDSINLISTRKVLPHDSHIGLGRYSGPGMR